MRTILCYTIIALGSKFPRVVAVGENGLIDGGYDYLGMVVGILSLLVTVLLGWNIFQLIDLKYMRKRDAREKYDLADFNESEGYIRAHHAAIIYNDIMRSIMRRQEDLKDIIEEFLFSAVDGIKYGIKFNDITKSNKHIQNMIYWLNQYKEPTISNSYKSILLSDLNKLRNTKGLENIDTLINLVSNFPTKPSNP
uniref:Uncharacterized protein n=1 Tax=Dulem virus 40 TaxID=3145758 RepID=A0AAU8AW18_9CAUD